MVLVTGGAGYIGSMVCHRLREVGERHLVLDSLENGHRAAIRSSELVVGDIRDAAWLGEIFRQHRPTAVMHLAAYIEVGESVVAADRYRQNNVGGTKNLLAAMREHGVRHLVFSSTAAVYGEPRESPITEDHPVAPTSPYGETKLEAEEAIRDSDARGHTQSVILRYFNAAGATEDGALGEDHRPETHLIPNVILAALGLKPEFALFGSDYDTPDGTCIRDYVHVCDIADAHILALELLRSGATTQTFNLGTGEGNSVREVIRTVEAVTGRLVPIREAPRRPGDPARLVASATRAKRTLGWKPRFADLATIVQHAYRWHSEHPNGYEW
jgi:UDP-glucose 4-epimerase